MSAERQTGRPARQLRQAPQPPGSDVLLRAFADLDRQRQHTDMGGPQPIQHRDIEAWCRIMRCPLQPAEINAVLALDEERRAFVGASRAQQPDDEDDDE